MKIIIDTEKMNKEEALALINKKYDNNTICEYYHTKKVVKHYSEFERGIHYAINGEMTPSSHIVDVGYCNGTMECDECCCGGDSKKCDFYPEKRA